MIISWPNNGNFKFLRSAIVKNSAWGISSSILQILFVCLFFVIVARIYSIPEFARFLISTTVYQLVTAFSSMGLGQWFIRQYVLESDKLDFTSKFLKTQTGLGILFYLLNIFLAFMIYQDSQIRLLCIILGTNIIFDNLINAIKSLNIAEYRQNRTAAILVIDGFLKLLVGCLLFINPFSSVILAILMVMVRIVTLGLFIKLGTSNILNMRLLWIAQISFVDLKKLVLQNWQFMVIGSISIIYWRMANIIISKTLPLINIADYELSFRIFSILQILPIIASATIFPRFIKYFNEKNYPALRLFYKNIFLIYTLFAIISYAFIYSFSGLIIPFAFGNGYPGAVLCLQQMTLTYLLMPTVLLQANLIVAIGAEKMDMWFNIICLLVNVAGCIIGLYFFQSLSVINYSILISFIIFHISQDILLVRKGLTTLKDCLIFYIITALFVLFYHYMTEHLNPYLFFLFFSAILIITSLGILAVQKRKFISINQFGGVVPGE